MLRNPRPDFINSVKPSDYTDEQHAAASEYWRRDRKRAEFIAATIGILIVLAIIGSIVGLIAVAEGADDPADIECVQIDRAQNVIATFTIATDNPLRGPTVQTIEQHAEFAYEDAGDGLDLLYGNLSEYQWTLVEHAAIQPQSIGRPLACSYGGHTLPPVPE